MRLPLPAASVALSLSLLVAPLAAEAQQPGKVYRIGVLAALPAAFAAPYLEAGRQRMRELGYVEGQTYVLELRFAEGKAGALPDLAADLVRLKVDVVVVVGDRAVAAAKQATSTIPIVMVSAGDPVNSGFVASLARPGGNITGLSSLLPELNAKLLALLKEAVPNASRVTVLWNPKSHGGVLGTKAMQTAAPGLGVTLQSAEVGTLDDIDHAFGAMGNGRAHALVVITDPLTFGQRRRVLELAAKSKVPAGYEVREFVVEGGLLSYGPSLIDMIRRSAIFVDKILRGARPADLPVEQPTKLELVINMKTAKALGVTIPQSLLLRADHVIE